MYHTIIQVYCVEAAGMGGTTERERQRIFLWKTGVSFFNVEEKFVRNIQINEQYIQKLLNLKVCCLHLESGYSNSHALNSIST